MTVLRDSIHMGSMSPSSTIHFGLSLDMLARSRMIVEKRPVGGGGGGWGWGNIMQGPSIKEHHQDSVTLPLLHRESCIHTCIQGVGVCLCIVHVNVNLYYSYFSTHFVMHNTLNVYKNAVYYVAFQLVINTISSLCNTLHRLLN